MDSLRDWRQDRRQQVIRWFADVPRELPRLKRHAMICGFKPAREREVLAADYMSPAFSASFSSTARLAFGSSGYLRELNSLGAPASSV